MSRKWKVIGSFVCFVVLLSGLFFVSLHQTRLRDDYANTSPEEKLSFSDIQVVVCGLEDTQLIYKPHSLSAASLITFLEASTANQVSQNYKHQVVFKPKHILNGLSDLRYYLYLLSLSTITLLRLLFLKVFPPKDAKPTIPSKTKILVYDCYSVTL